LVRRLLGGFIVDEGLKKVVMWSFVIGVGLGAASLFLGCTALDTEAAASQAGQPTIVDGAIGAVSAANYGIGTGLAALWASYQLLRKRTRDEWLSAAKALTPTPSDPSIRVTDALRHMDNAMGGGHTSTQGDAA
jgi:hypothetical protein